MSKVFCLLRLAIGLASCSAVPRGSKEPRISFNILLLPSWNLNTFWTKGSAFPFSLAPQITHLVLPVIISLHLEQHLAHSRSPINISWMSEGMDKWLTDWIPSAQSWRYSCICLTTKPVHFHLSIYCYLHSVWGWVWLNLPRDLPFSLIAPNYFLLGHLWGSVAVAAFSGINIPLSHRAMPSQGARTAAAVRHLWITLRWHEKYLPIG